MPNSNTLEPKQYLIRLDPCLFILAAVTFVWGFSSAVDPFSGILLSFSALILIGLSASIYRQDVLVFILNKTDLIIGAAILGGLTIAHWTGLFVPLGGDELYHASRSALFLHALKSKIDQLPQISLEEIRVSAWRMLDLRHLAILDIWRALSFVLVLVVVSLVLVSKSISVKSKGFIGYAFAGLIFIMGLLLRLDPENHPPLRLLPLIFGQTVFGLNDFAFRIPGIICCSLVVWIIFLAIDRWASQQPLWWKILSAISSAFIPIVFYTSEAVEASVYGYTAYVLMIIIVLSFIKNSDPKLLVWAGLVAGLAVLFRQSTIVLWLPVVVMFLASSHRTNLLLALRVFLPGLLDLPYMITAKTLGHAAISEELPIMQKLADSITAGVGIMSVINSTTLLWTIATVLSAIFILIKGPKKSWLVFLLAIPAYGMFYVIWTYLWGVGRYQAEYVAPFLTAIFLLQAISASVAVRKIYCFAFPILFISTLELNSNLSLDINYNQWPKMRITTTATFPYKEAFQFVKRQEAASSSVLLGGSPWYGEFVTWLYGYSFSEAAAWATLEDQTIKHVAAGSNQASFARFCREQNIKFVLIQSGTRREGQHRTEQMAAIVDEIESTRLEQKSLFYKVASFYSDHGGIVNIYTRKK